MKKHVLILAFGLILISIFGGQFSLLALGDPINLQTPFSESGTLNIDPEEQVEFYLNVSEGEKIEVTWDSGSALPVTLLLEESFYDIAPSGTFSETFPPGSGNYTDFNITLRNDDPSQAINGGSYSVSVTEVIGEPQEIPPIGAGGIVLLIAWLAVAGLACVSVKLPWKLAAPILLLANIGMIITWYGGQALAEVPRAGDMVVTMGGSEDDFTFQSFEMGENEGLIIYASMNFHIDDPSPSTIQIDITDVNENPILEYTFSLYSGWTGYKSDAVYIPLAAGKYLLFVSEGSIPLERFTLVIKKPGVFADISPIYLGEGIHILFLSVSILGIIIAAITFRKNQQES